MGQDGFNPELRECIKLGLHVTDDVRKDDEFMEALDAEKWLPEEYGKPKPLDDHGESSLRLSRSQSSLGLAEQLEEFQNKCNKLLYSAFKNEFLECC